MIWKFQLLCILVNFVIGQFAISLPATPVGERFQTKIELSNKQVYVQIDMKESYFQICCIPNRGLIQIIHGFLSNPFFQINQYTCPKEQKGFEQSEIKLPSIGVLSINHALIEKPNCVKGLLGLNKKSAFLTFLPVNAQTFKIETNQRNKISNTKISISFGEINFASNELWTFKTFDPQVWDIYPKSLLLGAVNLDSAPKVLLTLSGYPIQIPSPIFSKILLYFSKNQTCKEQNKQLVCLCESGIPTYYPKFVINFDSSMQLVIPPQLYMVIDSNICTLKIDQSTNEKWYINIAYFENTIFYFDRGHQEISVQKKNFIPQQSPELIHLPIQLILNCAVILLLCIFASLVIIEVIKRISGLSEVREQNLRENIIKRNIEQE